MNLRYLLCDVFTEEVFGGNPLAVFADADEIPENLMQKIAMELNLSETTFVLRPQDPANHFRVRIFTPRTELPMAGHPTIGTAFALLQEGRIHSGEAEVSIRFEEGVGVIPVSIVNENKKSPRITMTQPPPVFGPVYDDRKTIAALLSIRPEELDDRLPVKAGSTGVPFLFVPIRRLETMRNLRLRLDMLEDSANNLPSVKIFAFTTETERAGSTVHGRMFAPTAGIPEDPASGGGAGPLGCYLLHHGMVGEAQAQHIRLEQGFEMGRPSILHISIARTNDVISQVRVGGYCVAIGEGKFSL